MAEERITYPSASGGVPAYLAHPDGSGPYPGVIVIQEVFGLVPHIEDIARRFAQEGYVAIAPDLYCHDELFKSLSAQDIGMSFAVRGPDIEAGLAQLPEDRRDNVRRAIEWRTKKDSSTYIPDLQSALAYLQSRPDVRNDAIASIGYCMGGGLSAQLACTGADLAACVINYGPIPPLDQVKNIKCPVQGHYGSEDPGITLKVPELEQAMKDAGKEFTAYVYEGAQHGFFADYRPSYNAEAAKLTWERTLDFFNRNLKRQPVGAR